MRKLLKALLVSCTLSFTTGVNAFDICANSDPPDRFEYIPDKPVTLYIVQDMNIVRDACDMGMDFDVWGCTIEYHDTGQFEVYALDTGNIEELRCIIVHEYAHVNGWSYEHED